MSNLLCVALYGSYAKGTQNSDSDIDVLVIAENKELLDEKEIASMLDVPGNFRLDIKVYSRKQFEALVKINSLYVHHVIDCNKVVYGRELFNELTQGICEYVPPASEVEKLIELSKDCIESISLNGLNMFDLSVLFTFFRNALVLLNYNEGVLEFNKEEIIDVYNSRFSQKLDKDVYYLLYHSKNLYKRGKSSMDSLKLEEWKIYSETESLVNCLEKTFLRR